MKKIIILLSVITLASYSLLPSNGENDNEAIKKALQTVQKNISQYTDQEVDRAKKEIDNAVASVINRVDSTLTNQFTTVGKSFNAKTEETKKELSGRISGIKDNITKAKAISFTGTVIGVLGVALAFFVHRRRPRTDVNKVKDTITEEISTNGHIHNEIRRIAGEQSLSCRPQTNALSRAVINRAIEAYLTSKGFKDIL